MDELFRRSNFDAHDRRRDRYPAVLAEGLAQHGLSATDVWAVTQDLGVWAICTSGIFHGALRGMFKKRIEIDPFIPYAEITEFRETSSGPRTAAIVVLGREFRELARIDFSAGGLENTPELAATHRDRIREILISAAGASH